MPPTITHYSHNHVNDKNGFSSIVTVREQEH
jgi:hypothetical protein